MAALPAAHTPGAPCAVYVLYPEDLDSDVDTQMRGALASRGYEVMHSCVEMVTEVTSYQVMLALADPVEVLDVLAPRLDPIAVELWLHEIPYSVRVGNWVQVLIPSRLEPQVRLLLESVVPSGAWKAPREIPKPSNKTMPPTGFPNGARR